MKTTLRAMTTADYDAVRAIWLSCEGVGLNESDTREAIALYLERNPGMSFVATVDDVIVAAVLCGHDGRRGYLHHLAVDPPHRRRGMAKALVDRCHDALRAVGILKCNIFVYADNMDGQAFWLRNGWMKRDDLMVIQKSIA